MPQSAFKALARAWAFAGLVSALLVAVVHSGEITRHSYNQWPEALTLSNGQVEAVIVPAIGRVMQFRFVGESEGPFWENHALDGKPADSQSAEWINFGGDKTWPAPQGEWEKVTGRGWPPPKAFDSMPVEVQQEGDTVVLRSPIDPNYGIRTERRIRLAAGGPTMEITTTYEKVAGKPVRVGIWVITQLKDPKEVFMPLRRPSAFPLGYNKQSDALPEGLRVEDSLLTCTRSPKTSTKIGSDASALIWVGEKWILHIDAPREKSGEFPDNSSSAEIYTNPNPNQYVELEMLGPLKTLKPGEKISRRQIYSLYHRTEQSPANQVRSLLARRGTR